MLIKKPSDIPASEVTPQHVYLNRRKFLADAGLAGAALIAGRGLQDVIFPSTRALAGAKLSGFTKSSFSTSEPQTSYEDVTHYNNFYEFGTDKADPVAKSKNFKTSPWTVSIEGEVA